MSQENVEVVRKPLSARKRSRRRLDETLSLLFPRLTALNARLIGRLPPRSRLRQAALWRGARLAAEAYNRRDLEAVVVGWHRDFEYHVADRFAQTGLLEPTYRGLDGYRRYVAATNEVWGDENYLEPSELIDVGQQIVMLAEVPMRAQASGVALTEPFALVMTQRNGQITRLEEYYDHSEALEAVGLRE